jgi:hypothetical protein
MIIALILATASASMIVFLAGYRLAEVHRKQHMANLMLENDSLEPIFAALDREYKYTDNLNKKFSND